MGAAEEQVETLPEGTLLDGKFRIIRCVGTGGMGAVYEIKHELTHHRRALKLLHKSWASDREAVERFLREASVAGRIENPHITETFDAGWLASGEPYVVMEFLEGRSVAERLEAGGQMPVEEAMRIMAEACRGVQAAHDAGIVHRDLKPDNLFLVEDEGRSFVKLLDFGVSKFDDGASSRATRQGAFVGTPHYMSPEQFLDGRSVDGRSDVYSLGVILFECVTGRHPYPVDSFHELATKIITVNPQPPSAIRADVPAAVDAVILRALQKYPHERYQTAEELAKDLEALVAGRPQTMRQGSFWHADLAETREAVRRRDEPVVVAQEDASIPSIVPPSIVPPSITPPSATTSKSITAVVAIAALALAAIVAVVLVLRPDESAPPRTAPPPATTATPRATAAATEAETVSTAPEPPPSSVPTQTSAPSHAPSSKTPPRTTASSKTDHATVEEFPK